VRVNGYFIIILVLSLFIGIGCASSPAVSGGEDAAPPITFFEFRSGGAYHFQGLGEWVVTLDRDGNFTISHDVRGEITDYGVATLTGDEQAQLRELARLFDGAQIKSSARMGTADEVMYIFVVKDKFGTRTTNIWINDAGAHDEIVELVQYIGVLIEKYTGRKPALH
jgi:hypothetical protein